MWIVLGLAVILCQCSSINGWSSPRELKARQAQLLDEVSLVTLLVSVNDTWDEPDGCIATIKTQPLQLGNKSHNASQRINVGSCDHGPLDITIRPSNNGRDALTLSVVFHSSVIEDASPPACDIPWNGTYLVPRKPGAESSLLPGCFVMDSREGYHMTYYWFHILNWMNM